MPLIAGPQEVIKEAARFAPLRWKEAARLAP